MYRRERDEVPTEALIVRRLCAPALAAGALFLSACGGVLGPTVSPVIEELPDIACTVAAVAADDQNYTSAITGDTFTGEPEDDFSVEASRTRIFNEHLASLDEAAATLDGLEPADDLEKELVQAAQDDVQAARTLATNDGKYAPGDPNAPLPEVFPTSLDEAVEQSSQDIKDVFGTCTLPADVLRRQRAYGG
jgi:hypothetical protein